MALPDLFIPPWLRISGGALGYQSNTAASESIFTQAVRTLDRTGDKVRTSFRTDNASHRETDPTRAFLESFRARMRGQASRVWYGDPAYTQRGSFPSAELLTNGTFGSGATGWTPSSANISLAVTDRVLRSTRASVSADETIRSAAADDRHRRDVHRSSDGLCRTRRDGLSHSPGHERGRQRARSDAGRYHLRRPRLARRNGDRNQHLLQYPRRRQRPSDRQLHGLCLLLAQSLRARERRIAGELLDQYRRTAGELLRPRARGDWVQIGNQPCKVVQSLDSDSSGAGVLHLAYPPRTTPADNAPVIFNQPMGRFVATSNDGGAEYSPGGLSSHEFEFVEALDS
jgi:hypothetical protein